MALSPSSTIVNNNTLTFKCEYLLWGSTLTKCHVKVVFLLLAKHGVQLRVRLDFDAELDKLELRIIGL
jgi:hypothetical protein